jgi:hypothetical protein
LQRIAVIWDFRLTRIVTELDKNAVVAALRELAPKAYNTHFYPTTFEGEVSHSRVEIGYRFNWFVPPIRLMTFSGQIGENSENSENSENTVIVGAVRYGWIFYLMAFWWLIVFPLHLVVGVLAREFNAVLWVLAIGFVLFLFGRAFARTTREYLVREIARAIRGQVTSD